jgi:DNA modification methylase
MRTFRIIEGDALKVAQLLPSESVQTVVTSPPYFGLRDYGVPGQMGLEDTPELYVERMVVLFSELRRSLRKDGTLWLNIGDSYAGSGKGGNPEDSKWKGFVGNSQREAAATIYAGKDRLYGCKPKDLIGVPWMLAFALRSDGWYLRSDIIWHKPNPMPESVEDRPTRAHEYIFLLTKSPRYYYNHEAIKERCVTSPDDKANHAFGVPGGKVSQNTFAKAQSGKRWEPQMGGSGNGFKGHSGNTRADGTTYSLRNKRDVWTVTTQA